MIFSTLPQSIQYQIYLLTSDDQFQKRFGEDEVLDQLDQLKYDPFIQYCELQLMLHNKIRMNVTKHIKQKGLWAKLIGLLYSRFCKQPTQYLQLEPLTLGLWAFLYTLKSPIVTEGENITMLDVNMFFYLLQTKKFDETLDKILQNSMNYCVEKMGISEVEAVDMFKKLLKINFRVLNMFPRLRIEKKNVFNGDWMTSIVTKVKQVSSYSTQELYKEISFCEVYYLFAQYCRENGSEAIYLRTEEEIQIEIDKRSTELVVDRLIEKNVIQQRDREYYIKQIHVVKEKN